jgi:hypothetical protein
MRKFKLENILIGIWIFLVALIFISGTWIMTLENADLDKIGKSMTTLILLCAMPIFLLMEKK